MSNFTRLKEKLRRFQIRAKIFLYSREVQELADILKSDSTVKSQYYASLGFLRVKNWKIYKAQLEEIYELKSQEVLALKVSL